MLCTRAVLSVCCVILFAGCAPRSTSPVEDLSGTRDVSQFALTSLKGTRDGELLAVQAVYGDASKSLSVHLSFNVTPPAKLITGKWTSLSGEGSVRQRAVTFLGGQSGPPSIGGNFELSGADGKPLYRVNIPLQQLKQPL
ncbi:MAG: hypothetical protein SGI92_33175 [Bryobacteraceae bacterium]|nr:hypothetical protein [Bryobacteraceae bacterium]